MVNKHESLQLTSLKAEGTVSFFGAALTEAGAALQLPTDKPETQADAAFSLRFPGRCRLDVTTPEGTHLAVVDANGRIRNEGGVVQALNVAVDQLCHLLAPKGSSEFEMRGDLDRYLRQQGVETVETSLERQQDQVVYMLGKATADAAQLCVFKDSFLPARIRFLDTAHTPWELRFIDYNSPSAGENFPRIMEVLHQGEKLVRLTIQKADSHAVIPDKLFAQAP